MDFIHRPKSKILKILKPQRFGSWLFFRPQVEGEKRTLTLLFSLSIHLRTEAEPNFETL
jgi:hypothetical protein